MSATSLLILILPQFIRSARATFLPGFRLVSCTPCHSLHTLFVVFTYLCKCSFLTNTFLTNTLHIPLLTCYADTSPRASTFLFVRLMCKLEAFRVGIGQTSSIIRVQVSLAQTTRSAHSIIEFDHSFYLWTYFVTYTLNLSSLRRMSSIQFNRRAYSIN